MYPFSITIPIRSHLKKMLMFYLNTDPLEVKIGKCHYSAIFYQALSRTSFPQHHVITNNNFNCDIEIKFSASIAKENRFTIDSKRVSYIDQQLRAIFDEKFHEFLEFQANQKGDIQVCIALFMERYGITEEDITTDALRKSYYRYREKRNILDEKNFRIKTELNEKPIKSNNRTLFDD